jgi:uncharacterized protein (PEP-CTERM system associated)
MNMAPTATTIKESPTPVFRRASTAALSPIMAALMSSPYAEAAEWRITPTLDLRETYTDNVRLSSASSRESDFITDIAPGIHAAHDSRGLKFRAKYALHGLHYADHSEGNTILHDLDAIANAELVENLFFVDGTAAVHQQTISLLGPQPVDNTNITDNRSTVKTAIVSPYLRHRFGSTATSELRYTHSAVTSSTGGLASARTNGLLFNVNSGPSFRTLGWGLQYNSRKIDYDDEVQSVDATTTTGNLRYMVSPQLHLTATGGYDKYDYVSVSRVPEGRFYSAGFSWRPTERTSITASAGRRFWGKTYALETSLRSRSSVWQISYNEDITTTQSEFAVQATNSTSGFLNQLFLSSISDPALRQQAVDRFILATGLPSVLSRRVNYFTNQFFLQKGMQVSVAVTGARNTVLVSLFNVKRDVQSAVTGSDPLTGVGSLAQNANTRQIGANALWNWKITPLMDANFSAGYARTKQTSLDILEHTRILRAALARQLQPNVNGVIELRRQNRSTNVIGGDYAENAITATLSIRF